MPNYQVTVVKTQIVREDVVVTAANQGAAEAKAIEEAKSFTYQKDLGRYTYEVSEITVV